MRSIFVRCFARGILGFLSFSFCICVLVVPEASAAGAPGAAGSMAPPSTVPGLDAPELNVPIPGLVLSAVPSVSRGNVVVPFLAQYISALYNYMVGATMVVAAVMIIYGGFRYILGSTAGSIQAGKDIIQNALIGLVLLMASFTILNIFNPEAARLKPLEVHLVKRDIMTDFLIEFGTIYEGAPIPTAKKVMDGVAGKIVGPAASGTGAEPTTVEHPPDKPMPEPTAEVSRADMVDVSGIGYDTALSAPQNIFKYCSGGADVANAKTYKEKIKLLVKSVLGFYNVCINKSRCVYTQAGVTSLPGGMIGKGVPMADFAVKAMVSRGLVTLESLWPNNPECVETWNKKNGPSQVNGMPQCLAPARDAYNEKINRKIEAAKLFASDCVSFDIAMLTCAGPKWTFPGNSLGPAIIDKTNNKEPTKFMEKPEVIAFTNMGDPKLQDKLNAKGGIKFGDLIYVCCGGAGMHWYMYTGGRPDVPFSFIEMGGAGNGANVPGAGHIGGANVKLGTLADDISAKTSVTMANYWGCKPADAAKCKYEKKPAYNPATSLILIWRPYAEEAPVASSTP